MPPAFPRRAPGAAVAHRSGRFRRRGGVPSRDMRFLPIVVFARLCGAAGLGALVGAGVVGAATLLIVGPPQPEWLTGVPVLALLGAGAGLPIAWITRRWFAPAVPARRWIFAAGGLLAVPMATAIVASTPEYAFPVLLAGAALTVTLWVRGYRRETAQARAMMYGYGHRPAPGR